MEEFSIEGLEVKAPCLLGEKKILTPEALCFICSLHRKFNKERLDLLKKREAKQKKLSEGMRLEFLSETKSIRDDLSWKVAPIPKALKTRYVEITGPVERKMMINAANSLADVFMADFEDSLSPTWKNIIEGQINLKEMVDRTISFSTKEGKLYSLNEKTATLMVRPRGWHLEEKHLYIDKEPLSASLCDFGLFFFHNAKQLFDKKNGPYFYLPKIESHEEARLWNDIFIYSQSFLNIPQGSIRATVLIETILAAFEMEEILYELKDHIAGLNAGRWDYIFSVIKKFHRDKILSFPDRSQITMTVPFMRAYTQLLVQTCLKRGASPIGGMAAFIPNRKDSELNKKALEQVTADKERELKDGFIGTWVAHPDLVPVAAAVFNEQNCRALSAKKGAAISNISARDLSDFNIPGGTITEPGFRQNINICLCYLESWLRGIGAVQINNLMEDAATAEISRSLLWQATHGSKKTFSQTEIDRALFDKFLIDEFEKLTQNSEGKDHKYTEAKKLLRKLVTEDDFSDFFTSLAYEQLI